MRDAVLDDEWWSDGIVHPYYVISIHLFVVLKRFNHHVNHGRIWIILSGHEEEWRMVLDAIIEWEMNHWWGVVWDGCYLESWLFCCANWMGWNGMLSQWEWGWVNDQGRWQILLRMNVRTLWVVGYHSLGWKGVGGECDGCDVSYQNERNEWIEIVDRIERVHWASMESS